ncbi:zinc finger protein 93-like isoform X6 [Periplaneta americana]|uniref:zinc finger protein 93-like isoform X6 n=1 Tax=Periplaneta americana TaxID=6978 RepID=UPI0037E82C27
MLYVERENSGHLPNGEQEGDTSEIMETSIMEGEEYYNQEGGEWTQKVDTGQLCRVCANPNDYLIPIFDGEGLEHELSMKIQKHLPIKVTETDTLPQHMCYQCASTLIAWHDLVISCVEADKKLRELQMEENDDDDDKGGEMFESPSLDSEMTDDVIQPSTSETQNQNQVSKTPSSKKAAVAKEKKSKLKMILVKGPPAGTSGQKTASKTQVAKALELAKSKDGVSQDSASERCLPTPLTPFKTYHEACQSALQNSYHQKNVTDINNYVSLSDAEGNQIPSGASCNFCEYICLTRSELATHLCVKHTDAVFHCDLCDEIFHENKVQFMKHVESHTQIFKSEHLPAYVSEFTNKELDEMNINVKCTRFSCPDCGRIFSNKGEMVMHVKINHKTINSGAFTNEDCESLNMQIENSVEVEEKFPCNICGKIFRRKFDLKRHTKNVHFINSLKDRSKDTDLNSKLQNISKSVECCISKNKFTCNICSKSFPIKSDAIRHKRNSHFLKDKNCDATEVHVSTAVIGAESLEPCREVVCRLCGRKFTRKADMKRHVRNVHHLELTIEKPAELCDIESVSTEFQNEVYSSVNDGGNTIHQTNFSAEIAKFDVKDIKKKTVDDAISRAKIKVDGKTYFQCHICRKNLFRRCTYVRHMRIHTGEKPFTCHVCGKQFRAEPQIQRHVREVHEGIKEHACPICGRKFANTRTRNDHVTVHTGERRLVCHLCGKRFKTRATFHTHKRSHTNLFPHKCSHCGKSFRRQYECTKHMMIHTGERPFACDICGKCFRYQNEMIRHKLIHSDYKPFKCSICHLSFRQERYLRNHTMKSHRGHQLEGTRGNVDTESIGTVN